MGPKRKDNELQMFIYAEEGWGMGGGRENGISQLVIRLSTVKLSVMKEHDKAASHRALRVESRGISGVMGDVFVTVVKRQP